LSVFTFRALDGAPGGAPPARSPSRRLLICRARAGDASSRSSARGFPVVLCGLGGPGSWCVVPLSGRALITRAAGVCWPCGGPRAWGSSCAAQGGRRVWRASAVRRCASALRRRFGALMLRSCRAGPSGRPPAWSRCAGSGLTPNLLVSRRALAVRCRLIAGLARLSRVAWRRFCARCSPVPCRRGCPTRARLGGFAGSMAPRPSVVRAPALLALPARLARCPFSRLLAAGVLPAACPSEGCTRCSRHIAVGCGAHRAAPGPLLGSGCPRGHLSGAYW